MKKFALIFAVGAMAVMGGNVAVAATDASSISLNQFKPHVISVLVHVDAAGHATKVLPSVELPPALQTQLVDNINQWVVGPAITKQHKHMNSTMIMNVALQATQRADGKYDVSFKYLSAVAAPYGSAASHWSTVDNRLELVSDAGGAGIGTPSMYYQTPAYLMVPPSSPKK